jgi:hypothetical protein
VSGPAVGILVGPGVLGHLDGLHALAARVGVPVVNTWGAKGVFRWDDVYHGGTAGLQQRDFELAGFGEVDVLLTSGLDPDEVTTRPWEGRAEVIDVPPEDLASFAAAWAHERRRPDRPRLYTELAAVVQPLYADPASPASRVNAVRQGLPPGGVVFAPPGLVGFWVARTWSTTVPGSVVVPARADEGVTERLARTAAATGRPTMLLTDAPADVPGVDVVVWEGDLAVPQALLDVAGPVVAWT